MDEEEELDNTLIGQEEEAPAVNTGDVTMGAGGLPASAFGQEPAVNPFSVQVFEDPSFKAPNFDATPQTPEQERDLKNYGQEEFNEENREMAISAMIGQREGLEKPMSFSDIDSAREDVKFKDFVNRYFSGETNDPYDFRRDTLKDSVFYANLDLNRFVNTFAQPNSPQGNFLARMETGEDLTPQEIQNAQAFATSMGTTFDPKTGYSRKAFGEARNAEFNPQMTGLRPVDPRTGEFLSQDVIAAGQAYGMTFPSQVSLPVPQAPQAPIAPMGQEETRARLGGMTLNEYLNAPAGTPSVSGLRTDPQGRMIPNIAQFQAQPETAQPAVDSNIIPAVTQAPVDSAVPTAVAQPPVDALSSFERDSLARQQRIGGTGSFAGDSAAREARLRANERQPGESQAAADTRAAQSRTTGGQTEGLSFDDARRRAEGQLAARGVRNPSASQVNALARGIQAAEPERLAELATQRAKDAAELRDAKAKKDFKPQVVEIGGQKLIQLSPNYYQPVRPEPTAEEPFEPRVLEEGGFTYYEVAPNRFERQPSTKTGDATGNNEFINIVTGAEAGGASTVDATDAPQVATGRGQARRGRPIETGSEFTPEQEIGIQRVMADNDITRERAIEELKKAGKLK